MLKFYFKIPNEKRIKQREISVVKELVKRYSIGNVSLQRGHYITKEEAEKLKKEVLTYKF